MRFIQKNALYKSLHAEYVIFMVLLKKIDYSLEIQDNSNLLLGNYKILLILKLEFLGVSDLQMKEYYETTFCI